jgi:hypothetical protein
MKRLAWFALPLALVGVVLLRQTPIPDSAAKARDVGRLATVVPLIDELGLRSYQDQDGCRSIEYRAGVFVNDLSGTTCNFIDSAGVAFTDQAQQDYERIRRSLADTGVGVFRVYAEEAYIVFDLVERAVGRWAYVYEPGHEPAVGATDTYTDIDHDWYFMAWDPSQQ